MVALTAAGAWGLTVLQQKTIELTAKALPPDVMVLTEDGGHGSGVYLGGNYILTAAHVVKDSLSVTVRTEDNVEQEADVLWKNTQYDLAAIRIPDDSNMRPASFRCRDTLRIGDYIKAVGNPLDEPFVTMFGKVSAGISQRAVWKEAFLADLTAIPGMSGGAVYDAQGYVVGITVGLAVMPMGPFSVGPVGLGYIVPMHAACVLMGLTR
jgi:serine protease Do